MAKVTFNNKHRVFYATLKSSVDDYFTNNNLSKTGNWKLYTKTGVLIPSAILIYLSLLIFPMPAIAAILLSGLFGFVLASIGFNVMHDACHGSYSSKNWVNDLLGLSLNALGGNAFIWKFKHNIIHHTYTNIDGIDDDIAKSPLMRQCNTQKWVPMHRFQHVYVILVYAISSFAWVFLMDFNKYFKKRIVAMPLQKMDTKEHVVFWMTKILYLLFYIAIPVMAVGWKKWAIGFTSFHLVMGFTLAIVFQLAHVVEHTEFEYAEGDDAMKIEDEWAVYQVKTTANFAPKNKIISWFVGGLNFQVEHHLFPRISHVHYPAIRNIVKQTCDKFNIAYNEFPTMTKAVASHFKMMKQLGKRPVTVHN
ncbi:MAG TPA: acyl-CoA desaturase [Puia sp.]|nr:acyl-CoA desaturase [Puia sp.]